MTHTEVDPQKVETFIERQIVERKKFVLELREKFYSYVSTGTEQDEVLGAAALDRIVSELTVLNYLIEEKYLAETARKFKDELAKAASEAPQA